MVSKHKVDLKRFLHHGLLEGAFYGNNTIEKHIRRTNFSDHLRNNYNEKYKRFSFEGKESIQKKEEGTACRVSNKSSSVNLR